MKFPFVLKAASLPQFRLAVLSQGSAQLGVWVQMIASSWLVYTLTGSTVMLGVATFCLQIPLLVITPVAGVLIDRLEARKVLFATNAVSFLQSAILMVLVATGRIDAWWVVTGNLVQGIATAFDTPSRQSLLPRLVTDRAMLPNAIALNSIVMNSARFIGPTLGGIAVASLGVGAAYAVNAALRVAALVTLMPLRVPPRKLLEDTGGFIAELISGARFAFGFLPTRCALLLLAASSFCLQSYSSLMPWFAAERFHGDSRTLGALLSASGLGAVCGMVYLASRHSVRGLFRVIGLSATAAAVAMVAFSFSTVMPMALLSLFLSSMGVMLTAAGTNIVLQTVVPDELRGRIAAIYLMCFLGLPPIGSLLIGWLADWIGAPDALALCGAAALAAAGLYGRTLPAIRRAVWPVYKRLGVPYGPGKRWW